MLDEKKNLREFNTSEYFIVYQRRTKDLLVRLRQFCEQFPIVTKSLSIKERKLDRWINYVDELKKGLERLQNQQLNEMQMKSLVSLSNPELLIPLFLQPSLKNLFSEIIREVEFNQTSEIQGWKDLLGLMTWFEEQKQVIAMIGDKVLDLSLFDLLLSSNVGNDVSPKDLNDLREEYSDNDTLADFYDSWQLELFRTPSFPYVENVGQLNPESRGKIIEAIFGLIFWDIGYSEVLSVVANIYGIDKNE